MKTPFLVVGDFPGNPTGLSRILTDLLIRIGRFIPEVNLGVCGYAPWEHLPRSGTQVAFTEQDHAQGFPEKAWAFSNIESWGVEAINTCYRSWYGSRPGIIFTIWDPGRCVDLWRSVKTPASPLSQLPAQLWGYFPIDAENVNGTIAGPAADAIKGYDRILAYSEYGANILCAVEDLDDLPHLPHGIDAEKVWTVEKTHDFEYAPSAAEMIGRTGDDVAVIGCVATNQARKDLGMTFHAVRLLREAGINARLWLHTDQQQARAWNIPQLSTDMGLDPYLAVTGRLNDHQLADCYRLCTATVAPGRGEGFGYPIVESLACGTPVVHVDYAGGREFTPPHWRLAPTLYHLVGPYALKRPIVHPETCAAALTKIIHARVAAWHGLSGYCRDWIDTIGVNWTQLWPAWESWFREGL